LNKRKGLLVVLDGIDGSGKTTHSKILATELRRRGVTVLLTCEPTTGPIGTLLREHFLEVSKTYPEVEALLFAADRFLHLKSEIMPAIKRGEVVICDRYVYASLAYQGAQGLSLEWIRQINRFAVKPDLAICLDLPPEVAFRRIAFRARSMLERLELERKAREVYLKLAESGEMILVNALEPLERVSEQILSMVLEKLQ
jgi:dTMP kinase